MEFIRKNKLIGVIVFFMLSYAYAEQPNQQEPAAVITFTTPNNMIHDAYKTIVTLDKSFSKLCKLAFKALSVGVFGSDDDSLNLKFQAIKHEISHTLIKSKVKLKPFLVGEITIDIRDEEGRHYKFHLPQIMPEAQFHTGIGTAEEAKETVKILTDFIGKIDTMLPSNMSSNELNRFSNLEIINHSDSADVLWLHITHLNDNKAIISSLVKLHNNITSDLYKMLNLAQIAAQAGHTEEEMSLLDGRYYEEQDSLKSKFYNDFHICDNLKLFNDIQLTFKLQGKKYRYLFPKINLTSLGLDKDSLLSGDETISTLKHAFSAFSWARLWTVTGNTPAPLASSNNINLLENLSLLKLNREEMALIQHIWGNRSSYGN